MKLHAIPKSSPGRTTTDDFPPPLMRLPRAKSTKRASRSRANPMFPRKINKVNETNLEPSSPKVTCIGQVRVKRDQTATATTAAAVHRCRWFRKAKTRWFRRLWRRKFSFSRCDRWRKSEKLEEPERIEREAGAGDGEVVTISPPRNAFLLTRSKSAPYRSSSLANRILESKRREEGEDDGTGMNAVEESEETYGVDEEIGEENRGDGGSINGVEGFEGKAVSVSRCKSVPATQADKLFTNCGS
ncbi:hypothetical protein SSX86_012576 [Deinandra increscens subsp. villosa]|uniref:Protamine n=1 Tax=Deinandra increscens subsp. villosa TaxID=3103831 RepID=A0AAP0D9M8_9ASTR